MLNLEVLKSSTFTLTTIINMVVMMSLFGGMILLPIYLQNLRGSRRFRTVITSWFISDGYIRPITGKLLDTIGLKPLALFGIVMAYGTWELTKLNMDTPYLHIMSIYVIRSFGMAFVMMPLMPLTHCHQDSFLMVMHS